MKRINLIPFNKEVKHLEGSEIQIDIETKPDFLKDFIVISCADKKTIERLKADIEALKSDLNLENKLIIFNYCETPSEKIDFFMLKEEDLTLTVNSASFII